MDPGPAEGIEISTDPSRLDVDAVHAYLADVYILESHQGRGLGVRLIEAVMAHPDLQELRRWSLVTRDAHGLYRKFGFEDLAKPERYMEIARKDLYG